MTPRTASCPLAAGSIRQPAQHHPSVVAASGRAEAGPRATPGKRQVSPYRWRPLTLAATVPPVVESILNLRDRRHKERHDPHRGAYSIKAPPPPSSPKPEWQRPRHTPRPAQHVGFAGVLAAMHTAKMKLHVHSHRDGHEKPRPPPSEPTGSIRSCGVTTSRWMESPTGISRGTLSIMRVAEGALSRRNPGKVMMPHLNIL